VEHPTRGHRRIRFVSLQSLNETTRMGLIVQSSWEGLDKVILDRTSFGMHASLYQILKASGNPLSWKLSILCSCTHIKYRTKRREHNALSASIRNNRHRMLRVLEMLRVQLRESRDHIRDHTRSSSVQMYLSGKKVGTGSVLMSWDAHQSIRSTSNERW
jgi:hypothetical protein